MPTGTVLSREANFYNVRIDAEGTSLLCTRRARLKKTGQSVLVGDHVEIDEIDWSSGRGVIEKIQQRTSELAKPPIANCTGVLVVFALSEPPYDPVLLSRFLVHIEQEHLQAIVCLNKCDAVAPEDILRVKSEIAAWGYPVEGVSAHTGAGIAALLTRLAGTYVLAGPSGAGKSSLLNALQPGLQLRVGEISNRVGRGRHTTRHVELFALTEQALVADAPGFSQIEIEIAPEALAATFPEFRPHLGNCQFRNCLHREEPGCAVRAAELERYPIYRTFLAEASAFEQQRRRTSEPDAALKLRGGRTVVPRLDGQLRQASRRTTRQQLQQFEELSEEEE